MTDAKALARERKRAEMLKDAKKWVDSHQDVPLSATDFACMRFARALLSALEREPVTAEEMVPIIARRLAKRYWGEQYEGYESSQREAAEDIAAALNRAKQQEQS